MQLFGQSLALFSKERNKRITKKWDDQETQVNLQEIALCLYISVGLGGDSKGLLLEKPFFFVPIGYLSKD